MAVVESFDHQVYFLDLMMPGMAGLELASLLKTFSAGRPLPLVATTALGDMEMLARNALAGFPYHMMKVDRRTDPQPIRAEDAVTGQFRWVDGGTIELIEPDTATWIPVRDMIEEDRLSLLPRNGTVSRYRRIG